MVLKALAVVVGTFHGLVGLLGLVLFETGPEHWSVLTMSVALVSTPTALVLGAWGRPRLAAAWLALAALVWAVTGYRGVWPEWRYVALYYGPQLVAALFLLRQTAAATALGAVSSTGKAPAAWWLPQLLLGVVLLRRHRQHQAVTTLRDQQSALTALQR